MKRQGKIVEAMLDESLVLKEKGYFCHVPLAQQVQGIKSAIDVELDSWLELRRVQKPPAGCENREATKDVSGKTSPLIHLIWRHTKLLGA
jgi:hypothetical protein